MCAGLTWCPATTTGWLLASAWLGPVAVRQVGFKAVGHWPRSHLKPLPHPLQPDHGACSTSGTNEELRHDSARGRGRAVGGGRHGEDVGTASAHGTNHRDARETVELPGRHHTPVGIRVTGSWIIYHGVGDISKLTDSEGSKNDSDIREKCCGLFRVLTNEQKQNDILALGPGLSGTTCQTLATY